MRNLQFVSPARSQVQMGDSSGVTLGIKIDLTAMSGAGQEPRAEKGTRNTRVEVEVAPEEGGARGAGGLRTETALCVTLYSSQPTI